MFSEINKQEVFENALVSFDFEFYSPLKKNELAAKFARNLGKRVKWFSEVSESENPTREIFKISPTISSKFTAVTLSTGMLPYHEAVHIMLKSMNLIDELGFTTNRTGVTAKISLIEEDLGIPKMGNLNILKYLVNVNEDRLLEMWNTNNTESKKVKRSRFSFIHPKNLFTSVMSKSMIEKVNHMELNFPESDFFATNFSELGESKIIISYINGKDYQKKKNEAVETINSVIESVYSSLTENTTYSISESRKIEEMFTSYSKAVDSTKSLDKFRKAFPEIDIYVDLRADRYLIESTYHQIRNDLFKLVAYGDVKTGSINYDRARHVLQIKNSQIDRGIMMENVEFFDCTLTIDAKNCLFDSCIISESKLENCKLHGNNFIKESKVFECEHQSVSNRFEHSHLSQTSESLVKGEFSTCLVIGGVMSIDSSFDKSCKVLPS